ncbi:TPA: outer membrane assembly protein AsmA [Serratia marcescens]|jgi:AsmA protein|uniref:Outer membrane assembly protein AsmA n=1 Tax=Serratia marcescens TaxID=615 RepID=A0AAP8PKR8_SERMA|nr:outer membrane assembly protein AsmA [Serratia marcescens]MBH2578823.1 outer membrane assembly protein AsmA [Serratia marcescens]MBN5205770.1 outer membrane assembly protein AsmA [Serratia marcescens]MCA3994790.1 outer membrane assembly protein AsmA [Serratia marcescens]PNO71365.1 outer membrane assembly protein AsmA [Serratia marcescens]GJK51685.1 outer membrane assembly protein AsmA [Serratia marcescens]
MRRLLTTLAILLVVVVAGMSALVLLVNPNDFRGYMVKKVEQKSGYQLTLEGDLRWHIWPQLSILAGRMTLTAPGAKAPVVSAENMRLDVKLLPLLSHQLFVKQVMLKNAVIRLTPDSEEHSQVDAPIAPAGSGTDAADAAWKFDIDNLRVVDSLLIWQRADNEQINVRDINLTLQQTEKRQAQLELSSRVNRDQRDLTFSMAADVDLQQFPRQIGAKVTQFNYQLAGADILNGGIQGEGNAQVVYQQTPAQIAVSQLNVSANNSQLTGDISATLGAVPGYVVNLNSANLDLDALSGWQSSTTTAEQPAVTSAPVIASQVDDRQQNLEALRDFTAQLNLQAAQVTYRGMNVTQLAVTADNQRGLLTLHKLAGQLAGGDFSLPGTLDARGNKPVISVQPVLNQVELGTVLKAFDMPQMLTGKFSMKGDLTGDRLSSQAFERRWRGTAQLAMQDAQLHGLNIQQLIQQAVARNDNSVRGQDSYQRYTEVKSVSAQASLSQGTVKLSGLTADSPLLALTGAGSIDMPGKQCDMALNVRVTGGWQGRGELIEQLQKTPIPLRVYGPWQQLNYQLQVDQVLRKTLQDRAKDALNKWADKNKDSREGQDLKKLLDKL